MRIHMIETLNIIIISTLGMLIITPHYSCIVSYMPAYDRHWQQIAVDDLAFILRCRDKREAGRDRSLPNLWEKSLQVGEENLSSCQSDLKQTMGSIEACLHDWQGRVCNLQFCLLKTQWFYHHTLWNRQFTRVCRTDSISAFKIEVRNSVQQKPWRKS